MILPKDTMVYVYEIPPNTELGNGFCFGGPVPIPFGNVDWFNAVVGMTPASLEAEVRTKLYIQPHVRYLVLAPDDDICFMFTGEKA